MGKQLVEQSDDESSVSGNFIGGEDKQEQGPIYREQEMENKVKELQADFKRRIQFKGDKIPWHQHMAVTSDKKINLNEDNEVLPDIQKEVQFYNITLENSQLAIKYLEQDGIKLKRPSDYMAEMFKTDKRMKAVKNRLVQQQTDLQNFEEKKMKQQNKKMQKFMKNKGNQKRSKEKKDNLNAIDSWKQEIHKKGSGARDLSDFMLKDQKKEGRQGVMNKKIGKFDKDNKQGGRQGGGGRGGKGGPAAKGGKGGRFAKRDKFSKGGKSNWKPEGKLGGKSGAKSGAKSGGTSGKSSKRPGKNNRSKSGGGGGKKGGGKFGKR